MDSQWYCDISGLQLGPLTPQQLRAVADEGRLRPGMNARARIVAEVLEAALVAPLEAVVLGAAPAVITEHAEAVGVVDQQISAAVTL